MCHAQSRCVALQGQDVCTSSYCHSVGSVNTMLFICSNVIVGCIVTFCKDAIKHAVPHKVSQCGSSLCSFSISWHEFDWNMSFPPTATHTCNGHISEFSEGQTSASCEAWQWQGIQSGDNSNEALLRQQNVCINQSACVQMHVNMQMSWFVLDVCSMCPICVLDVCCM